MRGLKCFAALRLVVLVAFGRALCVSRKSGIKDDLESNIVRFGGRGTVGKFGLYKGSLAVDYTCFY